MNRVGWSIIVVLDKGLLVRNRVMGGHPVANQGVARMDKQNKQVMAGLVQLKFIQSATTYSRNLETVTTANELSVQNA